MSTQIRHQPFPGSKSSFQFRYPIHCNFATGIYKGASTRYMRFGHFKSVSIYGRHCLMAPWKASSRTILCSAFDRVVQSPVVEELFPRGEPICGTIFAQIYLCLHLFCSSYSLPWYCFLLLSCIYTHFQPWHSISTGILSPIASSVLPAVQAMVFTLLVFGKALTRHAFALRSLMIYWFAGFQVSPTAQPGLHKYPM